MGDDETIAAMANDFLEAKGLIVETCTNGTLALERITSNNVYELLLLDNERTGNNWSRACRRTAQLDHQRSVPIIIFRHA